MGVAFRSELTPALSIFSKRSRNASISILCGALASAAMDRAGVPIGGNGSVMMAAGIGLGIGWCIASIPMWMRIRADRAYSLRASWGELAPSHASHSQQIIYSPEQRELRP